VQSGDNGSRKTASLQVRTQDKLYLYQCNPSDQAEDSTGRKVWKHPAERAAFLAAKREHDQRMQEASRQYYADEKKKKRN
jgi:hypothetical protein